MTKISGQRLDCFIRVRCPDADADADDDDDDDEDDDDKDKVRLCFTREQSGGSGRYCSQIAHSATGLTQKPN